MKHRTDILTAFATGLLAITTSPAILRAAPVVVANPSFEDNLISDGIHTPLISGWNVTAGNTVLTDTVTTYNPTAAAYAGAGGNNAAPGMSGSNVLDLSTSAIGVTGVASQVLTGVPIVLGNTYTLTVSVGNPADMGFHGYNVVIGAQILGAQGLTVLATSSGNGLINGTFTDISVSYTPNLLDPLINSLLGTPLTIQLSSNSLLTVGSAAVDYDNVRFDVSAQAVPEPSTAQAVIAGLAVTGCIAALRRRRRVLG